MRDKWEAGQRKSDGEVGMEGGPRGEQGQARPALINPHRIVGVFPEKMGH